MNAKYGAPKGNEAFSSELINAISAQGFNFEDSKKAHAIMYGNFHKEYGGKRINSYEDRLNALEELGFDFSNTRSVKSLHNALKSTAYQKRNLSTADKDSKILHHLREKVTDAKQKIPLEVITKNSAINTANTQTDEKVVQINTYNTGVNTYTESKEEITEGYFARKESRRGPQLKKLAIAASVAIVGFNTSYAAFNGTPNMFQKTKEIVVGKFMEVMDSGYFNASNFKGEKMPVKVAENHLKFFENSTPLEERVKWTEVQNGFVQSSNRDDEGSLMIPISKSMADIDQRQEEAIAKGKARDADFEERAAKIWELAQEEDTKPSFMSKFKDSLASRFDKLKRDKVN